MMRKMQGSVTRSRFAIPADTYEEFPALSDGIRVKKTAKLTDVASLTLLLCSTPITSVFTIPTYSSTAEDGSTINERHEKSTSGTGPEAAKSAKTEPA
ncbi:unnamed protein product [Cuscuta epithymum]|uniref:Uncharacterized protein n=1 Tax=Cuscuta epithymum TaxID=186058 RepID=A0AAV0GC77_9ASTE|nr:unnamed protein product [Cuscuta epithymum]